MQTYDFFIWGGIIASVCYILLMFHAEATSHLDHPIVATVVFFLIAAFIVVGAVREHGPL